MIACLQFDHTQWFESTLTDRFVLQSYVEYNWKYGQIGLLLPVTKYPVIQLFDQAKPIFDWILYVDQLLFQSLLWSDWITFSGDIIYY